MLRFLLLCAVLAGAGCASRVIQPGQVTEPTKLEAASGESGAVRLTLEAVIAPDGPGSWTRQAHWDEYAVRIANAGPEPVTIEALSLESLLPQPSLHTTSLDSLRSATKDNLRWMASAAGAAALAGATTLVASGALFMTGSWAASATAFAAIGPVAAAGGVVYAVAQSQRDAEDNRIIQERLVSRGIPVPMTLAPGQSRTASAFFGASPGPKRLSVSYRRGGESLVASVGVEALAGVVAAPCGFPHAIENPEPVERLGPLFVVEDAAVAARLDSAILRNGRGSWMANAYWDEYRFHVRSRGKPVKVTMVLVSDAAGRRFPAQLPRCTPPADFSTTEKLGMTFIPLVGPVLADARRWDRAHIVRLGQQIDEWRTKLPAAVDAGGERRLRLFFPAIPQPRRIEIRYEERDEERSLVIDAGGSLAALSEEAAPLVVERPTGKLPPFAKEPGHVKARLTLDASGNVRWIQILESRPSGVYDGAARSAFSRWRYLPGEYGRTAEARIDFTPGEEK